MRLSRSVLLPALGLLLLSLAAPAAHAQGDGRERLRAEIERTDQALERALGFLRPQGCVIGQQMLAKAREQQGRAKELFGRATVPGDRLALRLTFEARKNIHGALDACSTRGRVTEGLQQLLASTEELAESARSALRDRPSAAGERFYEAGAEQLRRAREAYRLGRTRQSVRFLSIARNLFQRVLSKAELPGSDMGARAEIVLERSEALLEDLRNGQEADDDPRVGGLIDQATELQGRARELLRTGNLAQAVGLSTLARSTALEAYWVLHREPDPERVADAIEMIEVSCDEIASSLSTSEAGARHLGKARELLAEARDALGRGDAERAAAAIRAADSFLRRAAEETRPR